MFDSFGNHVKIKSSNETENLNLAGKTGIIYGETIPSITNIKVIGNPNVESAINVYFDDINESFWFDPDLLQEIDNGVGSVMTLNGVDKKWTKDNVGNWIEENITEKKWWQFWK